MRALAAAIVLAALVSPAGIALAQEPTKAPEKARAASPKASLSHKYQFGVAARAGTGYRVIAPYHEEFCGDKKDDDGNKSVCGSRQRVWLEVSPSFGITSSLELLVDVRLYLEGDTFTPSKAFFVAPSIKYYTDPGDIFKFFASGQLVLENQNMDSVSGTKPKSFDLGVRSALGLQFDVIRYLGLYVQGGVTIAFLRWLTFTVDFAGGIQARY
jgi:hypothetical protein